MRSATSMHRFNFTRIAIATAGALLLVTNIAVDLYRRYVNYNYWSLDYPRIKYIVIAATVALIIFGRFPVWLASALLLIVGLLQGLVIADSWAHVGRIAHGDDYGVFFVEAGEFYLLLALIVFAVVFHLFAAAARAPRPRSSDTPSQ